MIKIFQQTNNLPITGIIDQTLWNCIIGKQRPLSRRFKALSAFPSPHTQGLRLTAQISDRYVRALLLRAGRATAQHCHSSIQLCFTIWHQSN